MIELVYYTGHERYVVVTTAAGAVSRMLEAAAGTVIMAYPRGTRCSGIELDTRSSYAYQADALVAIERIGRGSKSWSATKG